MIGYDYTERIDPAALKAAGCSVVSRYLSVPGWPKNLTAPEATELRAAAMPILLNYETSADFMLGGYAAGVTCARSARQQATALGAPGNARIYYSADFDASVSQTSIVVAFLNGAASVDGASNVGVYGGLRVVQAAAAVGYATWQTIAWSNGQWDPRALMRQTGQQQTIGGVQVDVDEIINLAGLGAWGGPVPAPAPAPTPTTEDDVSFATGTIAPGLASPGVGNTTVVLPPPANSGAAGWGNVWFSLGSDMGDAHVRVAAQIKGVWTDFNLNFAVPAAAGRVFPLPGPLPTDVEKISITRLPGSENVPLAYLIEARVK